MNQKKSQTFSKFTLNLEPSGFCHRLNINQIKFKVSLDHGPVLLFYRALVKLSISWGNTARVSKRKFYEEKLERVSHSFDSGSRWDTLEVQGLTALGQTSGSEIRAPHCTNDLGVLGTLSNSSLFTIQTGPIGPEACFQNLGKQMFLLIFLSLMPECALSLHWLLNLPFFSLSFYF